MIPPVSNHAYTNTSRPQVQFWQHRYVQAGLWFDPEHEFKSFQVRGGSRHVRGGVDLFWCIEIWLYHC